MMHTESYKASMANLKFSYRESICFDLRSVFERQPLVPVACPMCAGPLEYGEVPPSPVGREHLASELGPMLDPTQLYLCQDCRWWAIRESGWYIEVYCVFDYFITGCIKSFELSRKRHLIASLKDRIERDGEVDTTRCEGMIAGTLRSAGHPCEVYRVGERMRPQEGRTDIYLVEDDDSWIVQVSRKDKLVMVIPLQNLCGFRLRGGKIHELVLRCEPVGATGRKSPEWGELIRGPFCVKALGPERLERLIDQGPQTLAHPWQRALDLEARCGELWEMSEEFASLLFLETVDWIALKGEL